MKLKSIKDISVKGKRVLVRVDYNVPTENGSVVDPSRIISSVPTIKHLVDRGAIVVMCSHFGKPKGKKDSNFSLKPVLKEAQKVIGKQICFISDCTGPKRDLALSNSKSGDVFLLENVRFYEGEEKNDPDFAKKLTEGFDYYVNEAFSESHRSCASIVGVSKFLPSFAGLSLINEIENLQSLFKPARPYVVVSGGAKISDKIEILKSFAERADVLMIGGAMANTFLAAEGYDVGKSLYEEEFEIAADEVKRACEDSGAELMLPDDVICAKSISGGKIIQKPIDEVDKSDIIVDIGPNTIAKYAEPLKFAGTILWNGPMGISEHKNSAKGTIAIAKIISASKAKSVIGGGDTLAAVKDLDLKFDYVSMGGGAALEFLTGKKLPGIEVLKS